MIRAAATAAALCLAACGGGEPAEPPTEPQRSETPAAPEPTAEAPPMGPAERDRLAEACVANSANDETACRCAADAAAERLDGRVQEFVIASLAGEEARAESALREFSMADLRRSGEAMQAIFRDCALRLSR